MSNVTMTSALQELIDCMDEMQGLRADMLPEEWALVSCDPQLIDATEGEIMDDWEYLLVLDVFRDLAEKGKLEAAACGELTAEHGWMQPYMDMATHYAYLVSKANRKRTKKLKKARS